LGLHQSALAPNKKIYFVSLVFMVYPVKEKIAFPNETDEEGEKEGHYHATSLEILGSHGIGDSDIQARRYSYLELIFVIKGL
jgi:hypothetical protein